MGRGRLNAVMILHVHKENTDKVSTVDVASELVESGGSDHHKTVFGKFSFLIYSKHMQLLQYTYCSAHIQYVNVLIFVILLFSAMY